MNKKELTQAQLDQLTNQVTDGGLSDEELENVDGGYWGFYSTDYFIQNTIYGDPTGTDYFIQNRIYGDPTGTDSFIRNVIYG
ncbi:MAG: hypothetical protein Tsb0014_02360 [Pleurocapsa sp.]